MRIHTDSSILQKSVISENGKRFVLRTLQVCEGLDMQCVLEEATPIFKFNFDVENSWFGCVFKTLKVSLFVNAQIMFINLSIEILFAPGDHHLSISSLTEFESALQFCSFFHLNFINLEQFSLKFEHPWKLFVEREGDHVIG